MKIFLFFLSLFTASAQAAEIPAPGAPGTLTYNNNGLWGGATVGTGLSLSNGTLSGTGVPTTPGNCIQPGQTLQYALGLWFCNNSIVAANGGVTAVGSPDNSLIVQQALGTSFIVGQPAAPLGAANGQLQVRLNTNKANTWLQPQVFPNNSLTYAELPALNLNQTLAGTSAGTVAAMTMPACWGSALALKWNTNTGQFQCGLEVSSLYSPDNSVLLSSTGQVATPSNPLASSQSPLGAQSGALALQLNPLKLQNQNLGTPTSINLKNAVSGSLPQSAISGALSQYTNTAGAGLDNLYACLRNISTSVCRIENFGDSILTCNQQAPCAYGPQRIGSTFPLLVINELAQRLQQYSIGHRAIVRLSNGATVPSAGDGYTLTSGTITNSTLLGPQESGVSLNGGSLMTLSSGAVLTINVGQPYSSVVIDCVQGSSINGFTVTINGSSVGQACNAGAGSASASIQTFANPVAFASQPATGSTLTLTALGATNYIYGYDAVLFCGASNTACTTGFTVDNFGVGGASSPWFASGTKTGTTDGGMVWFKLLSGQPALCILENGENDTQAGSGVTSAQQNAQNQIVATDCQARTASVMFIVPPPYNNGGTPATYAALQQSSLTYCIQQGWACLNMGDLFLGSQTGTTSSTFPFLAQDTGMGLTPAWGVAQGLITISDNQHLNDCGEILVTQQFFNAIFPHSAFNFATTGACGQNPQTAQTSTAYTNATTGFTIIQGATANTGQLEFVAPVGQTFGAICRGYMTVGTTGVVSFELVGSASISTLFATLKYQTAANSALSLSGPITALATAINTSSITAASNLYWELEINGVNSTSANSFAVEAHEASGTLTISAGATCINQMSGPQ